MPTYYTPPLEGAINSVIPPQLYCKETHRSYPEKAVICEDTTETVALKMKGAEDMFGWIGMNDHMWYNSVTGEKSGISPYE